MNCPLCNKADNNVVFTNKHSYFTHADIEFNLAVNRCNSCGFVFQKTAHNNKYDKVVAEAYSNYRRDNKFIFPHRKLEYEIAVKMIINNLPAKKQSYNVLEIGSNRGDLLYLLKEAKPALNVLGVDPIGLSDLQIPTIKANFEKELFSNKFDVIILQHVLEHIKFPKKLIDNISEMLDSEGILYVEVPNLSNSLKNNLDDFTPEHVNYFSLATLQTTLEDFKVLEYLTSPHLHLLLKKGERDKKSASESINKIEVLSSFNELKQNKDEMIKKISSYSNSGKKIVLYGASFYFKTLFRELKKYLKKDLCYYYDENIKGDFESTFNLPRLHKFTEDCVIIICSNVYNTQQIIEKKCRSKKYLAIVKPWSEIIN